MGEAATWWENMISEEKKSAWGDNLGRFFAAFSQMMVTLAILSQEIIIFLQASFGQHEHHTISCALLSFGEVCFVVPT